MTIENLVTSMSTLKAELKLIDDVDMERYNQAYLYAIDMLITKIGNIQHIESEYEYFKSLVR